MSRYSAAERADQDSRRVERVYSALARVYDGSFDWALGPGRRAAVEQLEAVAGDRLLEVGVGTGLSLPYYPSGCSITGIDITEPMLDQARQRADGIPGLDLDLRLMDARELDFPDATFDHVLAPYVISVVPEPERVMREMWRVCKPGGTVIVVNHFLGANPLLAAAERLLTPLSQWIGFRLDVPMERVTSTAGLTTVDVRPVNFFGLWHLLVLERDQ